MSLIRKNQLSVKKSTCFNITENNKLYFKNNELHFLK